MFFGSPLTSKLPESHETTNFPIDNSEQELAHTFYNIDRRSLGAHDATAFNGRLNSSNHRERKKIQLAPTLKAKIMNNNNNKPEVEY